MKIKLKKSSRKSLTKIRELSRLSHYLHDSEKKLILNSIVTLTHEVPVLPSYRNQSIDFLCKSIDCFYTRATLAFNGLTNIINTVHEPALTVNDNTSDFKIMLQKNDVCNHQRKVQTLLVEMFRPKLGHSPPIMGSMFKRRNTINNFRNFQKVCDRKKSTIFWFKSIIVTPAKTYEDH